MSCSCEQKEFGELMGVGALTDAGQFVERVDAEILTLDADVQKAIDRHEEPLRAGFNFNEWNEFVNGIVGGDGLFSSDPDDEEYLNPVPHGWKEWRGNLSDFDFLARSGEVMQTTARFEQRFGTFRESFVLSGGKPTSPPPAHPGVFETPQEEEQSDASTSRLVTWGIVIAAVTAAGYLLSSAAPLLPRGGKA